ncbi:hypothetical protein H9L01_06105 [Erysipelothrix inopinata]|uniref:Uncharacterized protein n=1 Tax=Erysipelothrix inopinata TaxID=225084 RepID=A0A7G9RWI5_9FIRM|nr:hypothetical protein [Erysipelothrix inopinata]QNN59960.1 hypothetical protein H9L01_06105 [Erysipelothrix inopinata]
MKKLFPLAIIGAAVGAAAYYFDQNNKKHVEKTLNALDEISETAESTVKDLAQDLVDAPKE